LFDFELCNLILLLEQYDINAGDYEPPELAESHCEYFNVLVAFTVAAVTRLINRLYYSSEDK
jgi:hypothetical protein